MLLATNVFDSVVESLESDIRRGGEHRREPRVLLSTRLTIVPCPRGPEAGLGAPLSVPVRDLSRGGLRFLLPRRLPLDTQFVVVLPAGPEGNPTSEAAALAAASAPAAGTEQTKAMPAGPTDPSPEPPMAVLCAVAYWQPLAKDLFAIGGQFLKALPNFQVPALAPRIVLPGQVEGESIAAPFPVADPTEAAPADPPLTVPPARRVAS